MSKIRRILLWYFQIQFKMRFDPVFSKYEFAILKYRISKYEICNIVTVFWNQSQNTDLQY